MAEGFFRELTQTRGGFESLSAGLAAIDGQSPSTNSVTAMNELGIDIRAQRSTNKDESRKARLDYF